MSLKEKLAIIQEKLNAPKNQWNDFGKYNYRSCEDILEGVKPLLKETKTTLRLTDQIEQVGDRYYIKATAILEDVESNEAIVTSAYARECLDRPKMDEAQITGSASTYARKYALNGLFCIDDVKDADTKKNGNAGKGKKQAGKSEAPKQASKTETPKQAQNIKTESEAKAEMDKIAKSKIGTVKVNALIARCDKENVSIDKIFRLYKVNDLEELTENQYRNINEHWEDIKRA